VAAEGPIDADALERLRAEGRVGAARPARGGAPDALREALERGLLRPLDVARAQREALEARLVALVQAGAQAEPIARDEPAAGDARPLPRTRRLATIALEALRSEGARPPAAGARGPSAFALADDAPAALARWGMLPEEVSAVERLAGRDLTSLPFEAHGVRG